MTDRTVNTTLRIPYELVKAANEAALKENRTRSNVIVQALRRYLRQEGYLPPDPKVGPL